MDELIGEAGKGDPLVQFALHSVYGLSYTYTDTYQLVQFLLHSVYGSYTLDTLTLFTLETKHTMHTMHTIDTVDTLDTFSQ